jgi:hypothetical protein
MEMERRTAVALILAALVACAPHVPFKISDADRQKYAAGGSIRVERPGRDPLIEGVNDCIVWKAETAHDDIVGWKAVLGADWGGSYPRFMTVCTAQTIEYRNGNVMVYLCAQAIGAGGGCANGGNYMSRTGERPWSWRPGNTGAWMDLPK